MEEIKNKKILAVDDEEDILRLYKTFLHFRGYDVITVSSAEQAIDFLLREPPDIILLDINMPGINGLTLLEIIKSKPQSKNTPIIMVTAQGDEETVKKAVALGCDNYIVKPFKLDELTRRIEVELFTLTYDSICRMLESVKDLRTKLFREIASREFNGVHWDPYYIKDNNMEICIMVPRGVRPASLTRHSETDLKNKIAVFFKHILKWKRAY